MSDILIGTDIEFPVISRKLGKLIAASRTGCSGTKGSPLQLPTGGVEIDNVSLELTFPPCSSASEFGDKLRAHMAAVEEYYDVILVSSDSMLYPEEELDQPAAREFGCDPDMNVYTKKLQIPNPDSRKGNLRSFGGHIHIGADMTEQSMVIAMDFFVGAWCVARGFDTPDRKTLYGLAGSYRRKPYGIEYRTVGNRWCEAPEEVFFRTLLAYKHHKNIRKILADTPLPIALLRNYINNCDVEVCESISRDADNYIYAYESQYKAA